MRIPCKTCSVCARYLPLTQFYADRRRGDGKRADCMSCNREKGSAKEKTPRGRAANLKRVLAYQARLKARNQQQHPTS